MVKKFQTGFEGPDGVERAFAEFARITIQVQLKKRDLGYRELTELLNKRYRVGYDERNIKNKIGRGTFSASFFLMVLNALDCKTIEVTPDDLRLLGDTFQ